MNKNDIRIGLNPPSLVKEPRKWFNTWRYKRAHKKLHNNNSLFYPTTPNLLEGIIKAINIQKENSLVEGYGYYEFGVFKGFSLWFAYMYADLKKCEFDKFYGFDSFEGLPKSKVDSVKPAFNKGHYFSSYEFILKKFKELDVDFQKLGLFKGFYSEQSFNKLKEQINFKPISICVIDVDIYESHVEALNFIKKYLVDGSIIIFDDWNVFMGNSNHSARKAFIEFLNKNSDVKVKHIFDFGWHGAGFRIEKK